MAFIIELEFIGAEFWRRYMELGPPGGPPGPVGRYQGWPGPGGTLALGGALGPDISMGWEMLRPSGPTLTLGGR